MTSVRNVLIPNLLMAAFCLTFRFQPKNHLLGDVHLSHPIKSICPITLNHITFSKFWMVFITIWFFSYLFIYCSFVCLYIISLLPLEHKLQQSRDSISLSLIHLHVVSFVCGRQQALHKHMLNDCVEDYQVAQWKKLSVSWLGPLLSPLSSYFHSG